MKTRATLALALVAGLPAAAQAQETFLVNYSWLEVNNGTTVAVAAPNSVVDTGESARIWLRYTALVNGSNAVGQTTNFTEPNPGGIGTIRGIGSVVYDLIGQNDTTGTWGGFTGGFSGPGAQSGTQPLNSGTTAGTSQPDGSVFGMGGAQFFSSGLGVSANGANNNNQVFRGVWRPNSYTNRTVNFTARASVLVPTGQQNSVLFAYGLGTDPDTGENFELYAGKYFATTFGQGLNIPIAPAPSSIALLGLGALIAGGRRR